MKKYLALLLILALLLSGCGGEAAAETDPSTRETVLETEAAVPATDPVLEGPVTEIILNGTEITVEGEAEGVYTSNDIIYYEDRDTYESGYPYGEGEDWERHSAGEAQAHIVVNITQPGNYRLCGTLEKGQIRIDLGEDAYENPDAVVNLVLGGVDITCTVAPAILFQNVYECDGSWSTDTARPDVDTTSAGANLILEAGSENVVNGSHVARIYKDKEGEKKLWKQDGAIYSYMSMNVAGNGKLDLYADNEGLDSELHLTIRSGEINIRADNDGINTNEDGVSVTTICGGNIHIIAGLGEEGDGIDSNGYLVIRGGTVVAAANPAADAGLDSDMGSYIHGGTVVALGSTMDWAESDSDQVTMNLQFASFRDSSESILIQDAEGQVIFAYDPGEDEVLGENVRKYQGAIISCAGFAVGDSYELIMGARIQGEEVAGIYKSVTGCTGGKKQSYTGTDVMMGPGGMGGFGGGQRPEGGFGGKMPDGMEFAEGEMPTVPEGMEMSEGGFGGRGDMNGEKPEMPEGETVPAGMERPEGGRGDLQAGEGQGAAYFYMQDKVNFFSGVQNTQ